jgi:inorganic pyrophosphatase
MIMKFPSTFTKAKNTINVIVETPNGSHNKYAYDVKTGLYKLKKILPHGTTFPLDFGFIPHTKGQDGDPIDVLVINDFPVFPGCLLECRVIGIIEAEQKEKKKKPVRNDRVIAVASESLCYSTIKKVADINEHLLNQVIKFFEYYNEMEEREFYLLNIKNKHTALQLIHKHHTR